MDEDKIDEENLLQYIIPSDLKAFGLIPEIIGRLPVLTHLDKLNREVLKSILTNPKNAIIKQYKKLFSIDDIELSFEDGTLDFIVDKALEFKLGARGLRSICETIMIDAMYELPSTKEKAFVVTKAYAVEKLNKSNISID